MTGTRPSSYFPDSKGFAGPENQLFILTSEKEMLGKS